MHKRKGAEMEFREAKQEWEDIFQTIGQHSFIFGTGHKIIACNKSEREIIGTVLSMRDVIGRKKTGQMNWPATLYEADIKVKKQQREMAKNTQTAEVKMVI